MLAPLLVLVLAACGRVAFTPVIDAPPPDAWPDTPPGLPCLGRDAFAVCVASPPTNDVMLGGLLDTDSAPQCETSQPLGWLESGQPSACFVLASKIDVIADLDVHGARPLVLAAFNSLTVQASIDVASHRGGKRGPGAGLDCVMGTPGEPSNGGAGGGAGGSLASKGGNGGVGVAGGTSGGVAPSGAMPDRLRGGCAGTAGGSETGGGATGVSGAPGEGGGAIYLVAAGPLTLTASVVINASGAGAQGSDAKCGGSGGGSGGVIVLHAALISAAPTAALMANGGGGSSGAVAGPGISAPGGDPDPVAPLVPGLGGSPSGGDGAAGTMQALSGTAGGDQKGGGGGGGGGGFVRANMNVPAQVSPPLVLAP